jgi:hypothetical protein
MVVDQETRNLQKVVMWSQLWREIFCLDLKIAGNWKRALIKMATVTILKNFLCSSCDQMGSLN